MSLETQALKLTYTMGKMANDGYLSFSVFGLLNAYCAIIVLKTSK